jgi:outer membrane lipoprotein LolB
MSQNGSSHHVWQGRLAIEAAPPDNAPEAKPLAFSASFELTGAPDAGEMTFLTPLGAIAGKVIWTNDLAQWRTGAKTRNFDGIGSLIQELTGTDVPITALFAWLDGHNLSAPGWKVDLSGFEQGQIVAQRLTPTHQARLRVILER